MSEVSNSLIDWGFIRSDRLSRSNSLRRTDRLGNAALVRRNSPAELDTPLRASIIFIHHPYTLYFYRFNLSSSFSSSHFWHFIIFIREFCNLKFENYKTALRTPLIFRSLSIISGVRRSNYARRVYVTIARPCHESDSSPSVPTTCLIRSDSALDRRLIYRRLIDRPDVSNVEVW